MARLMVVRLDDPRIGAGPATVISHVATVREFLDAFTDRDGARDSHLRLWEGELPLETRVVMKALVCGTGRGIFSEVK